MDQQVLKILRKYLDARCTPEELEEIRAILRSNRHEDEWATVLQEDAERSIDKTVSGVFDTNKSERLLDRIVESADIQESKIHRNFFKKPLLAAASILILITAGMTFFMTSSVFKSGDHSQTVTGTGEQRDVLLPDGTQVRLNDLSTLTYSDEFDGDVRQVTLEGRAFFDVSSNPSQPFLIQTGELTVRVLGTSFDISAYENDRNMTVSVASGSVSVTGPFSHSPGEEVLDSNDESVNTLKPGDQLIFDRMNRRYLQQTLTPQDILDLQEGRLIFQNQTLGDIAGALERRFDKRFRFEDELAKEQRLTFKPNSIHLDEVLQVLSLVSGLEVEMNKEEILMK